MNQPEVGDRVQMVLGFGPNKGKVREAFVAETWGDDPRRADAVAAKMNITRDEAIRLHGMRATLTILLMPGDYPESSSKTFSVKNAEHDPAGKRAGAWFRKYDDAILE